MEIADDVTIIRDGQYIGTKPKSDIKIRHHRYDGRTELTNQFPEVDHERGKVRSEIKNYNVYRPGTDQTD